ncbi:hypothetical protein AJ78_06347 [Emergomyces pasteurianus Ep9510]|uniref:BTB domain-containing protein n=1 Tax=Emergomyces pasteurianus Ep9510 TaxID=1447872 RepID=A0A1J9PZ45_9EURO|nr:hypothetical protein AJ78_06347 [Emergomyces pasteurianus Ep9510]
MNWHGVDDGWGDYGYHPPVFAGKKVEPELEFDNLRLLDDLRTSIASLYLENKYTDLAIVAGPEVFRVHRCIVCPRSVFFTAACDGKFREASSGIINLQEDPGLVKRMIEFLYSMQYSVLIDDPVGYSKDESAASASLSAEMPSTEAPEAKESATQHSHRNNEKTDEDYNTKIKNTSKNKSKNKNKRRKKRKSNSKGLSMSNEQPFYRAAAKIWCPDIGSTSCPVYGHHEHRNAITVHIRMFGLGERLMIDGLKSYAKHMLEFELSCAEGLKGFPKTIIEVYDNSPEHDRGLKDVVVSAAVRKLSHLRHWVLADDREGLPNQILKAVPEFMFDLLVRLISKDIATLRSANESENLWQVPV